MLYDDREEVSIGAKIKDSKMLGARYLLVMGNTLDDGFVELENNETLEKEKIGVYMIDGSVKAKKRVEMVDAFNNKEEVKVFLIMLKSGGTGLNLTSASMVVHFDPWFNPAVEDQASDRAHRIGQKNIVDVIKLISKDTVEEKVEAIKEYKKELADDIINLNLKENESIEKYYNKSGDDWILAEYKAKIATQK